MFNFFRRKPAVKLGSHIAFVKRICQLLPPKYNGLLNQIEDNIIKGVSRLDKPFKNYNGFSLDVDLLNKYENKSGRCFLVKGIFAYDLNIAAFTEVHLVTGYGLLLGYSSPNIPDLDIDLERINVGDFYIEYFGEDDFNSIKSIFSRDELELINPPDVYEVELKDKVLYHVKDLDNGDFIGIDMDKNVFKITHDPFEIVKLDLTLLSLLQKS